MHLESLHQRTSLRSKEIAAVRSVEWALTLLNPRLPLLPFLCDPWLQSSSTFAHLPLHSFGPGPGSPLLLQVFYFNIVLSNLECNVKCNPCVKEKSIQINGSINKLCF